MREKKKKRKKPSRPILKIISSVNKKMRGNPAKENEPPTNLKPIIVAL